MAKTDDLVNQLKKHLEELNLAHEAELASPAGQAWAASREKLLNFLKDVGRSGDIEAILGVERRILTENVETATSKRMEVFNENALRECDFVIEAIERVRDPEAYKITDQSYSLPRNRIDGLPRDQARQILFAHVARIQLLLYYHPFAPYEGDILEQRKANIRTVEKFYIALQEKAIGAAKRP